MKRNRLKKFLMSVFVSVIAFSNFGFFKGITKGITDVINIKVEQTNIKEEDQAKRKARLVKIAKEQANINEEEQAKDQAFIKAHLAEFAKEQGVELSDIREGDVGFNKSLKDLYGRKTRCLEWTEEGWKHYEKIFIKAHLAEFAKEQGVEFSDIREGDVRLLKAGRFEKEVLQWTEEGKKHYTILREEKLILPKKEKLLQVASNLDGEDFKDYGNKGRTPLVLRFLKSANRSLEVIKTLQSNDDEKVFEEISNRHYNKEMVSSKTKLLEVCRELIQCATNNYFEIDNKVKVSWFNFMESSQEIKFNIAGIKEAIGKAVQMRGTYADLLNLEHILEREVHKLKNDRPRANNDFKRYIRFREIDREINDISRYIADIRERKNAAEKAVEEMLLISESEEFPLRSIQSKPITFMKDIQSGVSKNWLKKYLIANEIRYEGGEKDDSSIIASYPQRKVYFCFYRNALISVEIVLSSTLGIFGGYSSDVSVDAFIKKYTTMLGPKATVTKRLGEVELGDSVGDTVSYCRIAKVWVETEIMSAFTQYSVSSMVTLPDNLAERMKNPFVDDFKKISEIKSYVKKSITKEEDAKAFKYNIGMIELTDRKLSEYKEQEEARENEEAEKKAAEAKKLKEAAALDF